MYDGVGKDTFDISLEALRPRGTLVLFGAASGKVPPFDPLRLMKGSYSLTRPTLGHFIAARHELLERAETLFGWIADGVVEVAVTGRYPLDGGAGRVRRARRPQDHREAAHYSVIVISGGGPA